ncbi:hypothetical protein [Desulfosporosinus hippei]|uniref:Uncharacterized protein n=1 Tax=Desulfosporosinus hippei DSM 8344 TaxID=1121419 RepID=A0A1G8CD84_9FIRM|nr:hypothetical protein [Desulfosporosinus hippei]SDH43471.1 hypothetical protein SAMN05443529_11369 [Desulfosporosinus hippei DSM 8344]
MKEDILCVNLLIDGKTTVVPITIVYEQSNKEEIKNIHLEIKLGNHLYMSIPSDATEFAVTNLQKVLPSNISIACCQSCRHGNFCPYGNEDNEIFCLKGMTYNNKMDVCDIFSYTQNIVFGERKRQLLDFCIEYEPISDSNFTYNDWGLY